MRISVIAPVKNEALFVGYSIMSILPYIHEIILTCASSSDGTDEILDYIKHKYAFEKLRIVRKREYDWNTNDMASYNKAYNDAIELATGDAVWFYHMDMVCTNPEAIPGVKTGPLAWWTTLTSYAGMDTVITRGRASRWKNIHAKKFGLHYYGAYGSQNEDFYHSDITGKSYVHNGESFGAYPFRVSDSGIKVNHYCEAKGYARRLEKMKSCLRNLYPGMLESAVSEVAANHPRVSLEASSGDMFGKFEFKKTDVPPPSVFEKYKGEFDSILRGKA